MKKQEIREELNTDLFKKIIDNRIDLMTKTKEERDSIIDVLVKAQEHLDALRDEKKLLNKQKKELNKRIRFQKRAIIKGERERFALNRELGKQKRMNEKLVVEYINEEDKIIDTSIYYTQQKTR